MSYPSPSYACQIWALGDGFALALPGVDGAPGHTVQLPANEKGLELLMNVLRARVQTQRPTVGTEAAPVQYDLDSIRKVWSGKKEVTLEDLL